MNGRRMLKAGGRVGRIMVTLLIVSKLDIASTIQGDALLARGGWSERGDVEGGNVWQHACEDVWLWWFGERFLMEDGLDERLTQANGISVDEVIFL